MSQPIEAGRQHLYEKTAYATGSIIMNIAVSIRWYLGYDLHEPLPFHSSMTRTRQRFGVQIFREFFDEIVGRCIGTGLVRGEEFFFDSTKVRADADIDSLHSRAIIENHLQEIFVEPDEAPETTEITAPRAPLLYLPATIKNSGRRTPLPGGTGSPLTAARTVPT